MPSRDARVDNRNADAGARQTERLLYRARACGQRRQVVRPFCWPVEVQAEDIRMLRHLRNQPVWKVEHVTVDDAELAVAPHELAIRRWHSCAGPQFDDDAGCRQTVPARSLR